MKKLINLSLLLIILVFFSGCATTLVYTTTTAKNNQNNNMYDISIKAGESSFTKKDYIFYDSIIIDIENKTNQEIEIIWDKSYYIYNGQTNGRFILPGMRYVDRNLPQANDLVLPKSKYIKDIYPSNLVDYSRHISSGFYSKHLPAGRQGVYLTLRIGNQIFKEKLLIDIRRVK